jgi:hypothetical protein
LGFPTGRSSTSTPHRNQALSRFVAQLGEKALPFYALMNKSDDKFEWTEEADTAFAQLKKALSTPPHKLPTMKPNTRLCSME